MSDFTKNGKREFYVKLFELQLKTAFFFPVHLFEINIWSKAIKTQIFTWNQLHLNIQFVEKRFIYFQSEIFLGNIWRYILHTLISHNFLERVLHSTYSVKKLLWKKKERHLNFYVKMTAVQAQMSYKSFFRNFREISRKMGQNLSHFAKNRKRKTGTTLVKMLFFVHFYI